MNRKIKSIFLNVFIVVSLLFLIFIIYNNIIETSQNGDKIDVSLLDSNNITLTQLMINTSKVNEKGPKPKPKKVAYITIDDGPSIYTDKILDILHKNNVKGTFFMIDENMNKYSNQLKRIKNEGHSLGFHSVSHDIKVLYKSPETTVSEFDKCKKSLEEITSETSNLIRLPYGSKPYTPEESYYKLINSGYRIWDWNLDTQDWRSTDEKIIENVKTYVGQHKEVVLLMHEKEQSVKALQDIIDVLKEKGYEIIPIGENDNPKNYWEQNLNN